jgi:hypothetical protein
LRKQDDKTGPVWGLVKDECSRNTMYSCIKMEKWDFLRPFQEWEEGG